METFLGKLKRNIGRELLIEEMAQLNPLQHGWVTCHRQLEKLESDFHVIRLVETSSKQLGWFLLLSGSWTGLIVFF